MKKNKSIRQVMFFYLLFTAMSFNLFALSKETEMLLKLLETKGILSSEEVKSFKKIINNKVTKEMKTDIEHFHSVKSLDKRLEKLEKFEKINTQSKSKIFKDFSIIGLIEAGVSNGETKDLNRDKIDESDITLSTFELDFDSKITDYANTHIALLYEEGVENNHMVVDEGFFVIKNFKYTDSFSLTAGKMYIPFGNYETHFISDPLTLILGETNDSALALNYSNDCISVSISTFKGAVKSVGNDGGINSYTASLEYSLPSFFLPELALTMGISYISNFATTDTLQTLTNTAGIVDENIDGISAFSKLSIFDSISFSLEYVGALKSFKNSDFTFSNNSNKPETWNIELGLALTPKSELAFKYEGSRQFADITPEKQYGGVFSYFFSDNFSVSLEHLYGKFKSKTIRNLTTLQLSSEF